MTHHMKNYYLHNLIITHYAVIFQILIIIVFLFLLDFIITIAFKRIHPKFESSKRVWDDALIIAVYKPLKVGIWLVGLSYIIPIIGNIFNKDLKILLLIEPLKKIGIIVLFLWFIIIFIRFLEKNLFNISISTNKKKIDRTSVRAVAQLFRLASVIIAILVLMQVFGVPISGILAFGGASGITLGFAAKDLLANFFGGLMIFLDRPFAIGDWIRSPDREIEGFVEYIGWRLTRIKTFDKRPLFVPNGIFNSISIENPSRMQNRRIKTVIGLRYEDGFKIKEILKDIEEMLKNHPDIDTSKTLFVHLINFGHSALEFMVYTFTKTTKREPFQKIQQDVFFKILEIIKKHDAQCAYPTTTIHFKEKGTYSVEKVHKK